MACHKWCLIYDPRAAAPCNHECPGHHVSCWLALPMVEHIEGGISCVPFRIGRTSKASAKLQRMPFEVARSVRWLKKTYLPLQGCSGRCPRWGWFLVLFVMGTKMASFVQKLHKPVFLSYMHAASKTSVLITSKDENQSTRALLALAEPYLSAPFPPVFMFCSDGKPRWQKSLPRDGKKSLQGWRIAQKHELFHHAVRTNLMQIKSWVLDVYLASAPACSKAQARRVFLFLIINILNISAAVAVEEFQTRAPSEHLT